MNEQNLEVRVGPVLPLEKQVHDALLGARFPLGRAELMHVARENEAPKVLLSRLFALPERRYHSVDDVQTAMAATSG